MMRLKLFFLTALMSAILITAGVLIVFFPEFCGCVLLPHFKVSSGQYMHAETTGISDWVSLDEDSQRIYVKFHPDSNPEALATLNGLHTDCHSDFFETIFGSLPGYDNGIRQRIFIKGKVDLTPRFEWFDQEGYSYFLLEDWYIETPFEVSMKNSDKNRTVHSYAESNCKDPRITKHMRRSW